MKNSDYWRKRFEQLEEVNNKQGFEYYSELERQYKLASKSIEQEIASWYVRFAKNNEISYAEAKSLLNSKELKEFRWTVEEYIAKGKENAISGEWIRQLENASARVHISRLESLKINLQNQCEVLFGNQVDGLDKTLTSIYKDSYYRTAYEIQRGLNVGYNFNKLNEKGVKDVISKPWTADGSNFSNRCWTAKKQLVDVLHTELTQAVIRGDAPDKAIENIARKFDTSRKNAGRLVMTESAFFSSTAQQDCFNELDIERYEIVATLDMKTSSICRNLDGKVFKMSDFKPGLTAPPFHCYCRSCTAPYFEDDEGYRAARNQDGKTCYIPSSMKYEDWKNKFINSESKDTLQKIDGSGIKKVEFKLAKTIDEANIYAKDVLSLNHADYTGLHIDIANSWNEGLADNFSRFPALKSKINFVGESHQRNTHLKPVVQEYIIDELGKINPGVNTELLNKYADIQVRKIMSNMKVPTNSYASSWSPRQEPYKQFAGITFNRVQGENIDKLLRNLKSDVERKFHPIGCDSVKAVLDHEIGHQLDKMLNLSNLDSIKNIFNTKTFKEITNELSTYSWKNDNPNKYGEFIAEAWSEYCNNPNPRPIAKEVGEIIEREYDEWKKMNS